jgi:hypothetical protein
MLLAVLPVNIAYSRFGWDASQTLLATVPAVYLPLLAVKEDGRRQRWLMAAAIAFIASLLVHPTNIFTAPLIALPAVWASGHDARQLLRRSGRQWIMIGGLGAAALLAVSWLARHWVIPACARLLEPAQLGEFLRNYQRLFSGITVYRYLAGSMFFESPGILLDVAWWLILAIAGWGLWCSLRNRESDQPDVDRCLLCGWAVMLCGFYLVAGPRAIAPHYERYGRVACWR